MISEGSCTEDWSNDADYSALHNINKLDVKYIKIDKHIIFHNITSFLYFWSNKGRFDEHKTLS